jgi:hypothetical protein
LIIALFSVNSGPRITENSATINHLDRVKIDGAKLAMRQPGIANFAPLMASWRDLAAEPHGRWSIYPAGACG